jgi:two-component system response regulator DesR
MPAIDGLSCIERVRLKYPTVKVVVLSIPADPEEQEALLRGTGEYVVRAINSLDLPSALRQAVEGPVYLAIGRPDVDETLILQQSGLTKRELTIVKAVARGLSNQAIAKELWVTEQTVKFHLTNIYRKLGVSNRTGAARWAYAQGLRDSGLYEAVGDNRN